MSDIRITPSPFGRWEYVPTGGRSLTAEQVEDVRLLVEYAGGMPHEAKIRLKRAALRLVDAVGYPNTYLVQELRESLDEVDALFQATEPAEEVKPISWYRTMTRKFATEHFGFPDVTGWFERTHTASDGGTWGWGGDGDWELLVYPPTPAEPAEEETKAEYPRTDGDFTVLGPEIFTDASGEFICWKGVNYVRQPDPSSSPVVPAPTETGPWKHRDGRICVYVQHLPLTLRYRIGRFNLHGDFVHDDSKRQLPEGFAPFVAAEEG